MIEMPSSQDYTSQFTPEETAILQRFNVAISGFAASVIEADGVCFLGGYHASEKPPTKNTTGTLNLPQWCGLVTKKDSVFTLEIQGAEKSPDLATLKTSQELLPLLREKNFPPTHPIFPRPREHRGTSVPTLKGLALCNPTQEQIDALDLIVQKHPLISERPSFAAYEKAAKQLGKPRRRVTSEKAAEKICKANTRHTCMPGEVAIAPGFNAASDLEPGYALAGLGSSDGAHAIVDAAERLWAHTWNYWPGSPFNKKEDVSLQGKANSAQREPASQAQVK